MEVTIKTYHGNAVIFSGSETFNLSFTADDMQDNEGKNIYTSVQDYLENNIPVSATNREDLIQKIIEDMSIEINIDRYI